jgi:hypothetical protein
MQIRRVSVISGIERVRNIPVDPQDLLLWEADVASIHELMPYLTSEDREFILSGITSKEWQEVFSVKEEEIAA